MERRGELRRWIRPWVHHNRVPNLTQDFGISGTATLKESLQDFSHLGAAPTDWRFVVGLLESPPQDVLVHERQELVEVARLERRPQSVAVHLRIIRPKGLGKADGAAFYERYLGAVRDTFDFGPDAVAFVGWPTFAVSSVRRPGQSGPSPDTTTIQLWWRASDAQALHDVVAADGIRILVEPFDGPFGRTFVMADPDGYRITIYEKDQPLFWPPKVG